MQPQYYLFALVGGMGFTIDTGIFTLLHHTLSYPVARIISITTAILFTWVLNRTFTFKTDKKICPKEWVKYAGTNAVGASINLSIFLSLCHTSLLFKTYYLLPLMLATSVSMCWNFTVSKYYVFR